MIISLALPSHFILLHHKNEDSKAMLPFSIIMKIYSWQPQVLFISWAFHLQGHCDSRRSLISGKVGSPSPGTATP